jgi:hypothetical protein
MNWMRLDCDTTLLFQFHIVKKLILKLPVIDKVYTLHNTVSQSRLSVVDVRNNTKVSYFLNSCGHKIGRIDRVELLYAILVSAEDYRFFY